MSGEKENSKQWKTIPLDSISEEKLQDRYNLILSIKEYAKKDEFIKTFLQKISAAKDAEAKILKALYLLSIPPSYSYKHTYEYALSILEETNKFHDKIKFNFAFQLVEAASHLNKAEELYENPKLKTILNEKEPHMYAVLHLALCIASNHPTRDTYTLPKDLRISALILFYMGKNGLYLSEFDVAAQYFMQTIHYARDSYDIKKSANNYLSLSLFLAGDSKRSFDTLCAKDVATDQEFLQFWEFDHNVASLKIPKEASFLAEPIRHQYSIRVLRDFAQTCKSVQIVYISDVLGKYTDSAIHALTNSGEFEIITDEDGNIDFIELDISQIVEERKKEVIELSKKAPDMFVSK
ncbi:hypothetical protein TVAG_149330 [Trichomonas vaginalis G3]|uniref:PCI domain containing protein n=1 Tax=Trichomonas vaginalis (strain ATCC PRA-98 / G3) TaxID=412133 RepID=A2ELK0_TRIV3|nr:hypothetical protein TVAGG3_0163320 [Trichomonas vaginalis G3]EAY06447.1 hypothetical protein TVAG_149330 [Trichomonas vaginalis G3]KAI5548025.1 hypothetical protein TVAGG3_0163320 [Trichomonas vaginalis G3]|eukprot:XP_001318670.1 hypothetical protein [Trichomonas vaginalis G3]